MGKRKHHSVEPAVVALKRHCDTAQVFSNKHKEAFCERLVHAKNVDFLKWKFQKILRTSCRRRSV